MLSFLKILQILSLDVVVAGLACLALATQICNSKLAMIHYVIFAISIWIIYTLDHLLDALKYGHSECAIRHKFHYEHFKGLIGITGVLASLNLVLALHYLSWLVLLGGVVLATLSLFHFLMVQKCNWSAYPKEFVIAFIFACGVWILPLGLGHVMPGLLQGLSWFVLFLSAYANLILLSIFERKMDLKTSPNSQIIRMGYIRSKTNLWVNTALSFLVLIGISGFSSMPNLVVFILVTSIVACWPLLNLLFYRRMRRHAIYRFSGDMIFWLYFIPVILDLYQIHLC